MSITVIRVLFAACVTFSAWADGVAGNEYVSPIDKVASYIRPGAFYQRELPCIMQVHQPFLKHIQYLIVD